MKRFEALTEPTGETSLYNPSFSSRVHIQTAKMQLAMSVLKTQNRCNLHLARDGDYSGFFLTRRAASLRIILRLGVPERVVFAAPIGEQFGVTALLNDRALVEHGDLVAEFAGGQAMGDIDGGLITCDLIELTVDLRLGDGVQRRRRLVEDDKGRVLIERAGNGDLLRLAAGNLDTVLGEIFVKHGVQTLFHRCKTVCEACIDQSLLCPVTVIFHAARHIVAQGLADELEILKYHGKYSHVIVIAVLADVDAVEQNLPLLRVVQAAQELDEGGLAAAVFAHDGKPFSNLEPHIHMAQRPDVRAGITGVHLDKDTTPFPR